MNISRYPDLAVELENRIFSGVYQKKLPTYLELQKEFSAAPATLRNALKLLENRKLLLSDSNHRRGLIINNRVRARKRAKIALVTRTKSSLPELDILEQRCIDDGFATERVLYDAPLHFGCPRQFMNGKFAGAIFLLSSITVEIALYMKQLNIPFAAANYLPVSSEMDMVEWDHGKCWEMVVAALKEKNYRDVMLIFPGGIENYFSYQSSIWQKIIKKYDMHSQPMVNRIASDRNLSIRENLLRFFHYLQKSGSWPEALLIWNGGNAEIIDIIYNKYKAPENMLVILPGGYEIDSGFPQVFRVRVMDYTNLFAAAYRSLRRRMIAPDSPYTCELLPYGSGSCLDFPYNNK